MKSILMTLLTCQESDAEFKVALRAANESQLREAERVLREDPKSARKVGRIHAALRRYKTRLGRA